MISERDCGEAADEDPAHCRMGSCTVCVLLWFCKELGQLTWGVLSVTLCLSPLTLALLCVGHCTQVPAAGAACTAQARDTALCLPGQSRTWVQVGSSRLIQCSSLPFSTLSHPCAQDNSLACF